MLNLELVIGTLMILFLGLISPGPDFVMVLRNSLTYGRRAGIFSALGIAVGCLLSFSLVVAGLKILFTYKLVKLALSIICGYYLIYLGIQSLRSKSHHDRINCEHKSMAKMSQYFINGFLTNVFNPKLYTISIAILTFPAQMNPSLLTNVMIILGQALMAFLWFSTVSLVFSHAKIQDAYFRYERAINIILGFILVVIGSKIMFG